MNLKPTRLLFLLVGLALFGSFAIVTAVHYLLPFDPLRAEPLIHFGTLFGIAFVVTFVLVLVAFIASKRLD